MNIREMKTELCSLSINESCSEYYLSPVFFFFFFFSTDLELPKISSCPGDITIISPDRWFKLTLPAVTVTDNVGVHLFTTNVVNGSEVTWGKHNITYTAKDKAGNAAYCRFLITIAGMCVLNAYLLSIYLLNKKHAIAHEVRMQAHSQML